MLRSLAVVITGSVLGVSALAQGQFGTAVEARAMLDKGSRRCEGGQIQSPGPDAEGRKRLQGP
jgi:hypothetical protein